MKIKLLASTLLVVILMASCQKDELKVTLKQAGFLNVQITDSTKADYSNIKISLFSYSNEIDKVRTDKSGSYNFGELVESTYTIYVDTISKGNVKYLPKKTVQIISGSTKSVKINPYDYVGTIKFKVTPTSTNLKYPKISTLNIALINSNVNIQKFKRSQVSSNAVEIETCNDNGEVTFSKIPSGISYYAYAYYSETDTLGTFLYKYTSMSSMSSTFITERDEISNNFITINPSDIFLIKTSVYLKLNNNLYYGSNVSNANVICVKESDYYSISGSGIETIKKYQKGDIGITNSEGKVIITNLPANTYYRIFVYNSYKQAWCSSTLFANENNSSTSYSDYFVSW